MNIDNRLTDPIFTPAPLAGSQPRQDNEQRERVSPAEQADAFAGKDERRERGGDNVALYDARGQKTGNENAATGTESEPADDPDSAKDEQPNTATVARPNGPSGEPLSEEDLLELNDLKLRDQEVRTHEQQHAAVGGQHAGAPSYEYETGPDGKQYAVEGEVQVDMSPVPGDPQATIEKMQQVKAAALAPAEPSQADKNAAARAEQLISEARAELQEPPQNGSKHDTSAAGKVRGESDSPEASNSSEPGAVVTDNSSQMQKRNDVIAGVYGRSAERQARALIGLA